MSTDLSTDLSAPVSTSAGTGWPDASDASAGYGLDPRADDLDQADDLDEDDELEADDVELLEEDELEELDEVELDDEDDHRPAPLRRQGHDRDDVRVRGDVREVRAGDVPAPGDVVAMLLDRVEAAEDLERPDVQDLALLLGGQAARRLARVLNREFARARRARPRRTFLAGLLGGTEEALEPAADSVSMVLLRIESGQRLTAGERRRLAVAAGRAGAVALERAIHDAAGPHGRWDR